MSLSRDHSTSPSRFRLETWTIVAYVAMTLAYGVASIVVGRSKTFWMDEVLAVWAARLSTMHDVIDAIWHGSEFSPPTYDLFLHALFAWFGSGLLAARMPSIIAIVLVAWLMSRIATARADVWSGVLVFGLVLVSPLFDFAVQARPYALLIAVQAFALLLWNGYPETGRSLRRALGIGLCLAMAMALHVYGLVGFFVLGLSEALWTATRRRVRLSIWVAFGGAGLISLAWLPLLRHLATFNSGDTGASHFYAKPTLGVLKTVFLDLSVDRLVFAALTFIVLACLIVESRRRAVDARTAHRVDSTLTIMTVALVAALPFVFLVGVVATHAFSQRYALMAALGFALLIAIVIRRLPYQPVIVLLSVPVICLSLLLRIDFVDATKQAIDAIAAAGGDEPVVIGDGMVFLQLMEGAPPDIRSRSLFLTAPPGFVAADPTNEHQILRLRFIRPDLPIKESLSFIADHPTFLEYIDRSSKADTTRDWVAAAGWSTSVMIARPGVAVARVRVTASNATAP